MVIPLLPENLKIKANKEVNEDSSKVPGYLNNLKEWINKHPHLKARTDDLWLLNFLRESKFDLNRTKQKLEVFYKVRLAIPELFSNRDPLLPQIQEVLNASIIVPLLSENVNAILVRWDDVNSKKISALDVLKVAFMICDVFLNESNTCIINGQHVINDLNSFPLSIMQPMSPILLKRLIVDLQAAYPLRIKGFHYVNTPHPIKVLYNLISPLFNQKIRERVTFHEKLEFTQLNDIPIDLVPKEYGGSGPSLSKITEEFKKKVESYRDWFLEDTQYYCEEIKRPKQETPHSHAFGVDGYFRKLQVD